MGPFAKMATVGQGCCTLPQRNGSLLGIIVTRWCYANVTNDYIKKTKTSTACFLKWPAFDLILQNKIKEAEPHHRDFKTRPTLPLIEFLIPSSLRVPKMHINLRKILFSYVAAAGTGLWLAEAQKVVEGGIAALYGTSKRGPWQEEVSDFDNLLQRPNATGNFPIPGPNVSSNSTAFGTSEGWSWSSK